MAKTNAQRQAEYRLRQTGKHRLNTWLSDDAAAALVRLHRLYKRTHGASITKRNIIEFGLQFLDKSCQVQMSPEDLAAYLDSPSKKRSTGK